METVTLTMYKREESGTQGSKKVRASGFVPGILYGHAESATMVKLPIKEMTTVSKSRGRAVMFHVGGGDAALTGKKMVMKELVKVPTGNSFLHVDFYEISDKEPITIDVPFKLIGKPIGVENGGMIEFEKRSVAIKALPSEMPGVIEVDVSGLNIAQSLHLSDIKLPAGATLAEDGGIPVVTVVPPKAEVALTKEEQDAQLAASLADKEKEAKEKEAKEKSK